MLFFRPSPIPRHPVGRLIWIISALAIGGALLMFGLIIGAVALGMAALFWLIRQFNATAHSKPIDVTATAPSSPSRVIEGEYIVVQRTQDTSSSR